MSDSSPDRLGSVNGTAIQAPDGLSNFEWAAHAYPHPSYRNGFDSVDKNNSGTATQTEIEEHFNDVTKITEADMITEVGIWNGTDE